MGFSPVFFQSLTSKQQYMTYDVNLSVCFLMVSQSVFMQINLLSAFYHHSNKVKHLMLLNHFSFKMIYTAIKHSSEGVWEENYRSRRTSRSQNAAASDSRMQGRAGRQGTSVLSIALLVTGGVTLGCLLLASVSSEIEWGQNQLLAHVEGIKSGRHISVQ